MAFAVSGVVITGQKGNQIQYVKKCEKCGYVQPGNCATTAPGSYSSVTSSFQCTKCKNLQKIVIKGN